METTNNCIVEKSFLFWKWKAVEHKYKMYSVSKFMHSSTTFHVRWICECGAEKENHFVTQDELLLKGIPMDEIKKITDFHYYYPAREKI